MNWDQAERELLALVKDSRKKLLDQHAERSRGELQAAILTMIHEEAELWQRRAAAGQCALLLDPGATEQKLADELLGYGVLASLMRNSSVSTIIVNAPTRVFTVSDGIMRRERFVRFESDEPVRELVKRHAAAVGRRFDEGSPRVDLGLPDGSRLHALMSPLTTQYTQLTIRKFTLFDRRLSAAVELGSMPASLAHFISVAVRAHLNIIFSGNSGVGKTTLMRMALLEIDDPSERVIAIESTRELGLEKLLPHAVDWQGRPKNTEGLGEISQASLMDDALRCEPSRIVIGESLGDEAYLLLEAMSAGHAGCVSSIHARSAREALTRLMIAAMKAPHHPPERLVQWMIAANIDLVIHLEKRGEARLVTEVIEVDSHLEGDHIPHRPLWHLEDGQLVRVAGAMPRVLDDIHKAGIAYTWEGPVEVAA
ncbi:MAG TPA: ATPase, T2SS/T4P/T4SS family [Chloroflexota bacterium]|jgi:pilus assembly protein CpaF